jgi:hypothetical protein
MEFILKSPSITVTLVPAIAVLASCLTETSNKYQQLLDDPESYAFCTEAGRSMRHLARRYSKVLAAALIYQVNTENDEGNSSSE